MSLSRVVGRALVHHRGRAVGQRPVDDVGVAGDPADVGRAPVDVLLGLEVEHVACACRRRRSGSRRSCAGCPSAWPSSPTCRGCTAGARRRAARPGTRRRRPPSPRAYQTSRPSLHLAVGRRCAWTTKIVSSESRSPMHLVDLLLDRRGLALAPGAVDGDQRLGLGELHALAHRARPRSRRRRRCAARRCARRRASPRRPRGSSAGRCRRRRPSRSPWSFSALANRWTSASRSA